MQHWQFSDDDDSFWEPAGSSSLQLGFSSGGHTTIRQRKEVFLLLDVLQNQLTSAVDTDWHQLLGAAESPHTDLTAFADGYNILLIVVSSRRKSVPFSSVCLVVNSTRTTGSSSYMRLVRPPISPSFLLPSSSHLSLLCPVCCVFIGVLSSHCHCRVFVAVSGILVQVIWRSSSSLPFVSDIRHFSS